MLSARSLEFEFNWANMKLVKRQFSLAAQNTYPWVLLIFQKGGGGVIQEQMPQVWLVKLSADETALCNISKLESDIC